MKRLRRKIIDLVYEKQEGHIPSALSILDIIYVLYRVKKEEDHFILSKGHGCLALYVVLHEISKIPTEILKSYCNYNSKLAGHPTRNPEFGITASTGSLGHGLPMAVGLAKAKKLKNDKSHTYCLVGDGEMHEGSMWEALLLAKNDQLDNLTVIIDYNHSNDRCLVFNGLFSQLTLFIGTPTITIGGHKHTELEEAFRIKNKKHHPKIILANTIKGKGIKMIEDSPHEWHHKMPTKDEYNQMIRELEENICENNS